MIGKASRIPGCQRIAKRLAAAVKVLRAIRILVGRAQGTRDERADQQIFLRETADALDRIIAILAALVDVAAELPGAAAVERRDALRARKRDCVRCTP